MVAYVTGPGPHIRAATSVPKRCWVTAAALLPLCMAALYLSGWPVLRVLGSAVSAALLAEWLAKKIFQKPLSLHDGHSLLMGLLFGCLCPLSMPAWMVALSCGFGIFVGKELFGGMGQYVFHPALVGQAFLYVNFPQADLMRSIAGLLDGSFTGTLALLGGGLFLLSRQLFYWEIPLLFAGVLTAGAFLLGLDLSAAVLSSGILFSAFFLIPEPATLPMARWGARGYAMGAGFLILGLMGGGAQAFYVLPFALLVMNALTPWIDARIRPRHATSISEQPYL